MKSGLVSVILPVYNGTAYLEATLESALRQHYPQVEIIAVDDGSRDASAQILERYAGQITVIAQANAGPAAARRAGVAASQGEYLAFLDQDDLWDEDKLARQVAVLQAHPGSVATYCDHRSIDRNGELIGGTGAETHMRASGLILDALIHGNFILSASLVMLRRVAYDKAGGFDVSQPYWGDDYDLWMRVASLGPFLYLLDTLVSYRRHGGNTSGSDYQMLAGNVHALKNVERFLARSVPTHTRRALRRARYRTTLGKAWQLRLACRPVQAFWAYLECLRLSPWHPRVWLGLVQSLTHTVLCRYARPVSATKSPPGD